MATPPGFVPTPPAAPAPATPAPTPTAVDTDPPGVRERINALNAQVHELRAAAERAAALERRAILAERRADSVGLLNTHPAVAEYASAQYDAYAATAGEKAKPYSAWLKEDAPSHPLVAPHLLSQTTPTVQTPAQTPAAPPPPTPAPQNPNAGVIPTPTPPVTALSEDAVKGWSLQQVEANLPQLLQQLQSEGLVKYTPPAKPTA